MNGPPGRRAPHRRSERRKGCRGDLGRPHPLKNALEDGISAEPTAPARQSTVTWKPTDRDPAYLTGTTYCSQHSRESAWSPHPVFQS